MNSHDYGYRPGPPPPAHGATPPYGQWENGQYWPQYMVPPAASAPGPAGPRRPPGLKIAAIAAAALVVLGGGGAFAADAYAKRSLCGTVSDLGDDSSGPSKGAPDFDELENALNSRADLLFFHSELKQATRALAGDVAAMSRLEGTVDADAPSPEAIGEVLRVAAAVDTHARDAQRACGLPEQGFGSEGQEGKQVTGT